MRVIGILTLLFPAFVVSALCLGEGTPDRKLLAVTWPQGTLEESLLGRDQWHPFPTWSNPSAFERVPLEVRSAQIRKGEAALSGPWTPVPASAFLEFVRSGNRSRYEELSFSRRVRLANLVLGIQVFII